MAKKTLNIQELLEYSNIQLARTDKDATKEFKSGICTIIEFALRETKQYNGYSHLDVDNCDYDTIGDYTRKYWMKKQYPKPTEA